MSTSTSTHSTGTSSFVRRRIVVVGGGIAGAEAALTLALGLRDVDVLLIGAWPSIRLLPDLVYAPFGVSPRRIDIPLTDLEPHGVRSVVADVERIDVARRQVITPAGPIPFDVLVAAPGAAARAGTSFGFRTLDDAMRIRASLVALAESAGARVPRTITIQAAGDDAWSAPACELAILIGTWARSCRIADHVDTMLVTADSEPFSWFGPEASDIVGAALRRARVQLATGVPEPVFDQLAGDLTIDVGGLEARPIPGLPGRDMRGWYGVDDRCAVADDIYVIGDATHWPIRAGFATAWQARRVLRALGGDPASLGSQVGGIPTAAIEYQMDLADSVLQVRMENADGLAHPFLGHDTDATVVPGGRPDKLAGLLLHDRVLRWRPDLFDAPLAFRDSLLRHARSEQLR
ncbi:MAG: hypothetical protein JWM90_2186 [Thermoleophilia bacterium]|nr:hypothetical protein [Thermoleophilia bacterium]